MAWRIAPRATTKGERAAREGVSPMTGFMDVLITAGVFALGLLIRLALVVLVVAVIAAPVLLALEAGRRFAQLRRRLMGLGEVAGLQWRSGLHYARGHTWLKREGPRSVRIGVDGLVQRLLHGVRQVVLPVPGTSVRRGERLAEIVADGRSIPVVAPLDGRVSRVNASVARRPLLVEQDPYVRGWLVAIEPDQPGLERFPRDQPARDWLRSEGLRLARFFEHDLGVAAADGGEFAVPPVTALSDERFRALAEAFLREA